MIRVGTSGWVYRDWRERFYPKGVAQSRWLAYYASHFDAVELNATTYRLPQETDIGRWCESVPPDFAYTVKLSRLITHRKSLPARVDDFIANYMRRISCFPAGRIAQVLVQFPPAHKRDDDRLRAFLDKLPPHHRYVVEFRDPSWLVPGVENILAERDIALCIRDYPGFRMRDVATSTNFAYVRLHGYSGLYSGSYPHRALVRWTRRLRELERVTGTVFVYFNNDVAAAAPHDAAALKALLA